MICLRCGKQAHEGFSHSCRIDGRWLGGKWDPARLFHEEENVAKKKGFMELAGPTPTHSEWQKVMRENRRVRFFIESLGAKEPELEEAHANAKEGR